VDGPPGGYRYQELTRSLKLHRRIRPILISPISNEAPILVLCNAFRLSFVPPSMFQCRALCSNLRAIMFHHGSLCSHSIDIGFDLYSERSWHSIRVVEPLPAERCPEPVGPFAISKQSTTPLPFSEALHHLGTDPSPARQIEVARRAGRRREPSRGRNGYCALAAHDHVLGIRAAKAHSGQIPSAHRG
jgi:hypothetical protein